MCVFTKQAVLIVLTAAVMAGCTRIAVPSAPARAPGSSDQTNPVGVTANSGGDTRGTILYQPTPPPVPLNPYASLSNKFVIGQRQKMAWALAEIDCQANQQAAQTYPVPLPSAPGYTKQKAMAQAERQAQMNASLLEKYRAQFCSQYHLSYDQVALLIQESREKNWPMPPVPGQ